MFASEGWWRSTWRERERGERRRIGRESWGEKGRERVREGEGERESERDREGEGRKREREGERERNRETYLLIREVTSSS